MPIRPHLNIRDSPNILESDISVDGEVTISLNPDKFQDDGYNYDNYIVTPMDRHRRYVEGGYHNFRKLPNGNVVDIRSKEWIRRNGWKSEQQLHEEECDYYRVYLLTFIRLNLKRYFWF